MTLVRTWAALGLRVLLLTGLLGAMACALPPAPQAVGGVLDLRGWDWHRGPVELRGTWTRDGLPRPVPDVWPGEGAATYRLRVLVAPGIPPLALRWETASTAMAVRANGTLVAQVGNPDPDPARAVAAYRPGSVRLPGGPEIDLEIPVSNHEYRVGGLWTAPVLGPADQVEADRWTAESMAVGLASTLLALAFFTAIFLAYLRSSAYLYSCLFAALAALRCLVTGEYTLVHIVPGMSFDLLVRLEYVSAYLPFPVAVMFFSRFFPGLVSRRLLAVLVALPLAFGAMIPWMPLPWLTRSILAFYPVALGVIGVLGTLVIRRVREERAYEMMTVGAVALAGAGLADLSAAIFFSRTGEFLPWGLTALVILMSAFLAREFVRTFERTKSLLEQKELLVNEVHHRVKNSLQVVASLVTLQSNRTADPVQKDVYQALRRRITAVALVHEKLYGKSGGRPDVGEYLGDLLKLNWSADTLAPARVAWTIDAEPQAARDDFCVDAGLILTELVGNGQKHGGPGTVTVWVRVRDGRVTLEVTDGGPGFPEGFQPGRAPGLGFRLIQALLPRNDGTLTFGPGGRVQVDLKVPTAAD
jgi:two-component sensor histidine kinase